MAPVDSSECATAFLQAYHFLAQGETCHLFVCCDGNTNARKRIAIISSLHTGTIQI